MADEKYSPMSITQHTNKVKFKDYVFSIETQEWLRTSTNGSVSGTFGRMAEVNVYLKHVNSPRAYEQQAMNDRIPLRNEKKMIPESIENYAIILHRRVKKEMEEKLKKDPRGYLNSIESIVEDYRKKNF